MASSVLPDFSGDPFERLAPCGIQSRNTRHFLLCLDEEVAVEIAVAPLMECCM